MSTSTPRPVVAWSSTQDRLPLWIMVAVAVTTFRLTSGEALAGVVRPLIEAPVLVAGVYVSLSLRRRLPAACPSR